MIKLNKKKITLIITVLLIAIIAATYPLSNVEKNISNNAFRKKTGGNFIQLSNGYTHYQSNNKDQNKTVLLVHGFSVAMYDWDEQYLFLSDHGFNVIRYDHFGRGFSDRPREEYSQKFYCRQINELMDLLKITSPFYIIGHSMGGGIAAAYTADNPDRVKKIILVSPIVDESKNNFKITLIKTPVIGPYLTRLILRKNLIKRAEELFDEASTPNKKLYINFFKKQFSIKGTEWAIRSLFKHDGLGSYEESYNKINSLNKPTILIYGDADKSVSLKNLGAIQKMIPSIKTVVLKGIGHMPTMQDSEKLNAIILAQLSE